MILCGTVDASHITNRSRHGDRTHYSCPKMEASIWTGSLQACLKRLGTEPVPAGVAISAVTEAWRWSVAKVRAMAARKRKFAANGAARELLHAARPVVG